MALSCSQKFALKTKKFMHHHQRGSRRPPSMTPLKPSHTRSHTNPENISFMPQPDNIPSHTRSMSTLCSPVAFAPMHERRSSSVSLDGQTLEKYGFPTYRQIPSYISNDTQPETFIPSYYQTPQRTPSPLQNSCIIEEPLTMSPIDDGKNTTLIDLPHIFKSRASFGPPAQHPPS